jgi:hypothetical protein
MSNSKKLPIKKILIGAPLALIIGVSLLPSSPEKSERKEEVVQQEKVEEQKAAEVTKDNEFSVGQWVEAGERAIQVNTVEEKKVLPVNNPFTESAQTSGKFVVVYITYKNTSDETGNMMFSTFNLVDGQGREYDESSSFEVGMHITENEQKPMEDDIFPGGTGRTLLVFEVNPDASDLQLQWKGQKINLELN